VTFALPSFVPAVLLWHGAGDWPWSILIALACGVAVWWWYPPQVRTLSRAWRWTLPTLRSLAVVALAVAVLKPVFVRPKAVEETGAVVVLIDRSASMDVVDDARAPADRVRLAAGLGLLPSNARGGMISNLYAHVQTVRRLSGDLARAAADIDYARLAGQGTDDAQKRFDDAAFAFDAAVQATREAAKPVEAAPVQALVRSLGELERPTTPIDPWFKKARDLTTKLRAAVHDAQAASDQKMYDSDPQVKAAAGRVGRLSRAELVDRSLVGFDRALFKALPKDVTVYAFSAGERVEPYSVDDRPTTAPATRPSAGGSFRSDLLGGVRGVVSRLGNTPILAVVLLSDGRQVGGDAGATSTLGAISVPVFTVGVASQAAPRDVSVARVTLPASAYAGESVTLRAEVRGTGLKGKSVPVTLDVGGEKQTAVAKFTDDTPAKVEFTFKPKSSGIVPVTLSAGTVDGEVSTDNNVARRSLKVMSDRVRVAMLTPAATWDFQYVRNSLSRAAWATVSDQILFKPDAVWKLSPDEILSQQVVILSDVGPGRIDARQWEALYKLVTERAASVIIIAGQANVPGAPGTPAPPIYSDFLPFLPGQAPAWRTWPGTDAQFRLKPTEQGTRTDAMRLGESSDLLASWASLPGFFRVVSVANLKPNATPLLVERDSGQAVLTESRLGKGRVFFFGAEETWRWRAKVGERDQDRFWTQFVRYAGEEPYAAVTGGTSLDVDRVVVEPGESVQVRARVLDDTGRGSTEPVQSLRVTRAGQVVATVPLRSTTTEPGGRYAGTLSDLAPGDYELQLGDAGGATTRATTNPAGPVVRVSVRADTEAELVNLSGDEEFLRSIASATGGEYLSVDQITTLPDRLDGARQRQSRFVETRLWDGPYLFVFVLGCLGAEWGLRKRLGLS